MGFEWAPELQEQHVQHCRLWPTRHALMRAMVARGSIGAELGVQTGRFSQFILTELRPSKFHLIDIALGQILHNECTAIRPAIASGQVALHEGDSRTVLPRFEESSLDWIYVDGDHEYDVVRFDLAQAARVVKPGGLIVCNDYTQFSPIEGKPYGVQKAVNELCLRDGWELMGFGLHGAGYHDVALRKLLT